MWLLFFCDGRNSINDWFEKSKEKRGGLGEGGIGEGS